MCCAGYRCGGPCGVGRSTIRGLRGADTTAQIRHQPPLASTVAVNDCTTRSTPHGDPIGRRARCAGRSALIPHVRDHHHVLSGSRATTSAAPGLGWGRPPTPPQLRLERDRLYGERTVIPKLVQRSSIAPRGRLGCPDECLPEGDGRRVGFVIAERPCRCSCTRARRVAPDPSGLCESACDHALDAPTAPRRRV